MSGIARRLKRVFIPSGDVTEKAVKSGLWEGSTNTLNRVIQVAKITVLSHFLPPSEFGLLGIGFLALQVLRHLSQVGTDAALIQRSEEQVDEYLNTVWSINVVRGVLLAVIAAVLAPYIAAFFAEPRATPVIRVVGIIPLFQGFRNPGTVYFSKHLEFHKRSLLTLTGTSVNFAISVVAGIIVQNVWALVWGAVGGAIVTLGASYVLHDYRPAPQFDPALAGEVLSYGKWILGSNSLAFLIHRGDDAFVGWFLGASALGIYQVSIRLASASASEITAVLSQVTFPTFSQVQGETSKLRSGYIRTLRLTSFLSFPSAMGIIVVAPSFITTFYGNDWIPVIPVLQVLALAGLFRSVYVGTTPLFNAVGRPDLNTKTQVVKVLFIAILIYPATLRFDLIGTAMVIVLSGVLISTPLRLYLVIKVTDSTVSELLVVLVHPIVGSVVMGGVIFALGASILNVSPLARFLILVSSGVAFYAAYTVIAVRLFGYDIRQEFQTIVAHLTESSPEG